MVSTLPAVVKLPLVEAMLETKPMPPLWCTAAVQLHPPAVTGVQVTDE